MLFQCVFKTIYVFVVGSFKDIFKTKIKNTTRTRINGISHSIWTELVEIYMQQHMVYTLMAKNVKNHVADAYIFILL